MKYDLPRWMRHVTLGIVVASVASTGCSSTGWKMPSPSKMFSWGKKPSETAVAGSGPSALTYPESPASKQTPSAIASAAVKPPATPGATTAPTNIPSYASSAPRPGAAPYTAPTAGPTASYTPPSAGAAATANGYATGPYNTFGQAGSPTGLANAGVPARPAGTPGLPASFAPPTSGAPGAPTGLAATNPFANAGSPLPGLPTNQVYGGAAGGSPAARPTGLATAPNTAPAGMNPGYAMPSAIAAPRPTAPAGAVASFPAQPNGFSAAQPGMGGANPVSMPAAGGMYSPIGTAPTQNSMAQLPPAGMPTMQSGGFAVPGMPAGASSPNGFSQVPAQTAGFVNQNAASNMSTASFRPGSTGRTTGYTFGGQAPEAAPNNGSAANVASGFNNPGYNVPPNSTLNR